ncbi:MAG: dethiobiotin synthase [Blastopirellula sp.]|nr:MAG: dethiobiotin synthase [Blastopirellula sp.]
MTKAIIVTGTDTDIGKTIFAAALTQALAATYWKPVQAGLAGETDSQTVARLSRRPVLPEVYRLKMPASPHLAAETEGLEIDPVKLQIPETSGPVVIEAAGGLMVPLNREKLFLDLIADWRAPVVLCARTTLGTINHSLLSIAALHHAGCPLMGVAFVGNTNPDVETTICDFGGVANLGCLPLLDDLNSMSLAAAFSGNFETCDFLNFERNFNDA